MDLWSQPSNATCGPRYRICECDFSPFSRPLTLPAVCQTTRGAQGPAVWIFSAPDWQQQGQGNHARGFVLLGADGLGRCYVGCGVSEPARLEPNGRPAG